MPTQNPSLDTNGLNLSTLQVPDFPAALLHFPAERAVLAARHGGDDRGLPQEDARGDRPRHNLQRTQGLRALDLVAGLL